MKIAMISYHTCPLAAEEGKETGGMNVYVYNLSLELARLGHTVDVFTRSEDAKARKIVEVAPNFRVIHLQAGPEETLPKKELINFIPEFAEKLEKYIPAYEILHAHYYMSGLAAMPLVVPLRRDLGQVIRPVPTIISFHTLALLKNLVARSAAEAESQTRIDAEMEIVKRFDKIIAPSETEREYLRYFYSAGQNSDSAGKNSKSTNSALQKIEIIPPGFDPQIFHPINKVEARQYIGADPQHKIILFVGRIEPLKGIDVLMYALKIITQRCRTCPICLWIVGGDKIQRLDSHGLRADIRGYEENIRGNPSESQETKPESIKKSSATKSTIQIRENPELRKLYELHQTLKLHSYVRFIGQQHQSQLPFFYNAADVVVMPSHYESFGMSALEAMACGTPVITTNVTGISTMFENDDGHTVISANNPLELAGAIEKIISVGATLAVAHGRGQGTPLQNIQNFTWGKMARKMEKVYERINANN